MVPYTKIKSKKTMPVFNFSVVSNLRSMNVETAKRNNSLINSINPYCISAPGLDIIVRNILQTPNKNVLKNYTNVQIVLQTNDEQLSTNSCVPQTRPKNND